MLCSTVYLSYGTNKVTVYHSGEHTCPITPVCVKKDVKSVEELVRNNPNIKPSEIQSAFVISAFQKQMDWDTVEKQTESTIDKKWVDNIKQKVKGTIEPFGHNFEGDYFGYIFRAFAPKDAPQVNQAEVIHVGWAHRDRSKLSMLDACQADVRDSLVLDVTLKNFQHVSTRGGVWPFFC